MKVTDTIYVAGHAGLVGSALCRRLDALGYRNIITRQHGELDLRDQAATRSFFRIQRPRFVFLAAARVGGILANSTFGSDFIHDNILISANVIDAARESEAEKLINLGSSCIYPRLAPQPLREESLLTGPLEPTNEPYAIAKIAAIKLCRYCNEQHGTNFLSAMPSNLYGPHDNFDLQSSHVLPALVRKMHDARARGGRVSIWGDGTPLREFLYVDDLAEALVLLMERFDARDIGEFINIGTGVECSIRELAERIARTVGFSGGLDFDGSKPNGTPRKVLDTGRISALGWRPRVSLEEGIARTYQWYKEHIA